MAKTAQVDCSEILKVLADQTRLDVIRQLMDGPRHVNKLNNELKIEQSLLSHHLKIMRQAGLVESERDGKAVLYRLSRQVEGRRSGKSLNLGCCKLSFD